MKKLYLGLLCMFFGMGFTFAQDDVLKDSFEIYFELNKAVVKEESKQAIQEVLDKTTGRRLKLRITGHTCDLGTNNFNMGLSEKRAKAAFEYLNSVGEAEDKIELFFYGEKELKYDEREPNRRVHLLLFLEDDDIDTLIQKDCASVFVEKGTYKPNKNKKISFSLDNITTASAFNAAGLSTKDQQGRNLYFNSVVNYKATAQGQALTAGKTLKVKLPQVNEGEEGFNLYTFDGSAWKNTGKPCVLNAATECKTYDFELTQVGICGCAKPRKCEADCSKDPFGGDKTPNLQAADIRYSGEKVVVRFENGTYAKSLADVNVTVVDDNKFEADLDLCGQFMKGLTTEQWFKSFFKVKNAKKNIIIKAKDGASEAKSNDNKMQRVHVPTAMVNGMDNPVLVLGNSHKDGYVKWGMDKYEQKTCLGPVNCDYVVFDVPATGNYKLAEWSDAAAPKKEDKYLLKVRVLKNCEVYVGNKSNNFVYKSANATRRGKTRTKEFNIKDYESAADMVLVVRYTKKGKHRYQEANLSDLKFKKRSGMYIMRKRDFKKIDDFANMELSKCK